MQSAGSNRKSAGEETESDDRRGVANLVGLREGPTISGRNDGVNDKMCTRLAQAEVITSDRSVINNRESCVSRACFCSMNENSRVSPLLGERAHLD
jgi:hypothetical protein